MQHVYASYLSNSTLFQVWLWFWYGFEMFISFQPLPVMSDMPQAKCLTHNPQNQPENERNLIHLNDPFLLMFIFMIFPLKFINMKDFKGPWEPW